MYFKSELETWKQNASKQRADKQTNKQSKDWSIQVNNILIIKWTNLIWLARDQFPSTRIRVCLKKEKTPFCYPRVGEWKIKFLKTITSLAQIPVNAHAPIKDGILRFRVVFVWMDGQKWSIRKMQGVTRMFFCFQKGWKLLRFPTKGGYARKGPKRAL